MREMAWSPGLAERQIKRARSIADFAPSKIKSEIGGGIPLDGVATWTPQRPTDRPTGELETIGQEGQRGSPRG